MSALEPSLLGGEEEGACQGNILRVLSAGGGMHWQWEVTSGHVLKAPTHVIIIFFISIIMHAWQPFAFLLLIQLHRLQVNHSTQSSVPVTHPACNIISSWLCILTGCQRATTWWSWRWAPLGNPPNLKTPSSSCLPPSR